MKETRLHHEIQNLTEGYHITEQRFLAVLLRLGTEVKTGFGADFGGQDFGGRA